LLCQSPARARRRQDSTTTSGQPACVTHTPPWDTGQFARDNAPVQRDALKRISLAAAMAEALQKRGIADPAASLAAELGVLAFRRAHARWADPAKQQRFSELARQRCTSYTPPAQRSATRSVPSPHAWVVPSALPVSWPALAEH